MTTLSIRRSIAAAAAPKSRGRRGGDGGGEGRCRRLLQGWTRVQSMKLIHSWQFSGSLCGDKLRYPFPYITGRGRNRVRSSREKDLFSFFLLEYVAVPLAEFMYPVYSLCTIYTYILVIFTYWRSLCTLYLRIDGVYVPGIYSRVR